jgi:hypothetical protein
MWLAVLADVGVMSLTVLNAIRTLYVEKYECYAGSIRKSQDDTGALHIAKRIQGHCSAAPLCSILRYGLGNCIPSPYSIFVNRDFILRVALNLINVNDVRNAIKDSCNPKNELIFRLEIILLCQNCNFLQSITQRAGVNI